MPSSLEAQTGNLDLTVKFSGAELAESLRVQPPAEELSIPTAETLIDIEADVIQTLAERHPDWPKLDLRVLFAFHDTAEDWRDFGREMTDYAPQIYLTELMGHTEAGIASRQKFADATDAEVDAMVASKPKIIGRTIEAQVRGIYGTGVTVGSIDLRADSPEEIAAAEDVDAALASEIDNIDNFPEVITTLKEQYREIASAQRSREAVMVSRLEGEIARIFQVRPSLKEESELRILITMGAAHTTLFGDLREETGANVSRSFGNGEEPYVYSYNDQILRHYMHGVKREVSDETVARAYVERVTDSLLKDSVDFGDGDIKDNYDAALYCRYVADHFDPVEAGDLFREYREGELEYRVDEIFQDKGIGSLPTSNAELHAAAEKIRADLRRKAGLAKVAPKSLKAEEMGLAA